MFNVDDDFIQSNIKEWIVYSHTNRLKIISLFVKYALAPFTVNKDAIVVVFALFKTSGT